MKSMFVLVLAMFAMVLTFSSCGDESDCDCDDGGQATMSDVTPEEFCDLCLYYSGWCNPDSPRDIASDELLCLHLIGETTTSEDEYCEFMLVCLGPFTN